MNLKRAVLESTLHVGFTVNDCYLINGPLKLVISQYEWISNKDDHLCRLSQAPVRMPAAFLQTFKWAGYRRWLWEEAKEKARADAAVETKSVNGGESRSATPSKSDEKVNEMGGDPIVEKGPEDRSRTIVQSVSQRWFSRMRRRQHAEMSIPEVENIYDRGLVENFREVLFPRSTRTGNKID